MNKESVALRIILVGCLIIFLLIPLWMIQSLISERRVYRDEAVREISKSWAGSQSVAGPILTLVTNHEHKNKEGVKTYSKKRTYYLPEDIAISADVVPEKRYRGIYSAILYKSDLQIKGKFNLQSIKENLKDPDLTESYLSFNIDDPRGIQQNVLVKWDNTALNVIPGLKDRQVFTNGFHTNININTEKSVAEFEISFSLNGVDELNFVPIGKNTKVTVSSSWNDPSFVGSFLPASRNIDENGFTASWNVNHFNREFPQEWTNQNYDVFKDKFGVKFFIPADEYQQTMRSSKYGILLVILTFLSFFLVEVFSGKAIHPIQYLLIGLGLIIFYSMLLALSEYILFQYSYLVAAALILGLITLYTKSVYHNRNIVMSISAMLFSFYGFVYVLLQLQDYSLLLGNIAMFSILAAIMFFTRKVNWFDVLKSKSAIQ